MQLQDDDHESEANGNNLKIRCTCEMKYDLSHQSDTNIISSGFCHLNDSWSPRHKYIYCSCYKWGAKNKITANSL